MDFDVIVLGAGNAGQAAASVLRKGGKQVAIVESGAVGGLCPLRGCVPKKVLVAAAESLDVIERCGVQGVEVGPARIDWPGLMGRKREILAGTSASMEESLRSRGIELLRGRARFSAHDRVTVDGRELSAESIVIATGSTPRALPIPGFSRVVTTDEVLELDAVPPSVVFVGAGVVALELGHVLARAGAKVTLLEAGPRPLLPFDEAVVAVAVQAAEAAGIAVHAGVRVTSIESDGVRFEDAAGGHFTEAALVVNGAGRVAALDELELKRAGIAVERGKVRLDGPFRSAENARVWFAGDALPTTPQLSPLATAEGRLVGRAILGADVSLDYATTPSCVFAIPTLAMVGETEAALQKNGTAHRATVNDMTGWRSGRSYAERFAFAKVLVGEDDRILGAHLLGHGAGETIHAFAFAMRHGVTATELRASVYAYPTFHSDLVHLM